MAIEVYKSEFSRVLADPDKRLVIQEWFPKSRYMTDEDFKNEIMALTEKGYRQFWPKKVLVLQREFKFIVSPELQTWAAQNSGSVLESVKTEKIAFVLADDIFVKVSVEQTMGEKPDTFIQIKYFDNEEDARKWLF